VTAAHCFRYDPDSSKIDKSQLNHFYVLFGPSISNATRQLRITDYQLHPAWIANGHGTNGLGGDIAVVQVYDASTNGPVSGITTAQLFNGTNELASTNFPVIVGYGMAMYGADTISGPVGGTAADTGGIKRGAINEIIGFTSNFQ
jgi:hypothetical protein